ncbi:MAG: carbohydrate kinase [Bacteroidota bacterium]
MSVLKSSVICFGEVLWDLFPNGAKPGGAPMNVAVHLQNFNISSGVVSRLGYDRLGDELMKFLKSRGVATDLIQIDRQHETGVVRINVDKKDDPVYTIVDKVAWDFINDSFLSTEFAPKYLVHGSLASRAANSSGSLQKLLEKSTAKVVFDINVRTPYYSKSVIDSMLKKAHIVKMNQEEFKMIKDWFYIKNPREQGDFKALKALYPNIETMLLTKGAKGAVGWQPGKLESVKLNAVEVKDTVGSGDAFLSAFLAKTIEGADFRDSVKFAAATGALVATREGANPEYSEKDVIPFIPAN